jgi:hypothetical protein
MKNWKTGKQMEGLLECVRGLCQMMGLAIRGIHIVSPSGSGVVLCTYVIMDVREASGRGKLQH